MSSSTCCNSSFWQNLGCVLGVTHPWPVEWKAGTKKSWTPKDFYRRTERQESRVKTRGAHESLQLHSRWPQLSFSAPWEISQRLSCSGRTGPQWHRFSENKIRTIVINPGVHTFWFFQECLCLTFVSTAAADLNGWNSHIFPKGPPIKSYPKCSRGLLNTPDGMTRKSVFVIILLCSLPTSFPVAHVSVRILASSNGKIILSYNIKPGGRRCSHP